MPENGGLYLLKITIWESLRPDSNNFIPQMGKVADFFFDTFRNLFSTLP